MVNGEKAPPNVFVYPYDQLPLGLLAIENCPAMLSALAVAAVRVKTTTINTYNTLEIRLIPPGIAT
jgi:hypothetical protein